MTCAWVLCDSPAVDAFWCADHAARLASEHDLPTERVEDQ